MKPLVVIVLCHNQLEYTAACVESIVKSKDDKSGVRVVLVDNASTDGTLGFIEAIAKGNPLFDFRHNDKNEWFTEANDRVIREFAGWDIFMLNNDTQVRDGWLSGRKALLSNGGEYAAIGAVQEFKDDANFFTFTGGGKDFAAHNVMWKWELDMQPEFMPSDWLTGAALMIDRDAYEAIGGLDLGLLHYCQDSDLSLRLIQAGYKICVARDVKIMHVGGLTTRANKNQGVLMQGGADQSNFAKKHKIKCGEFDYRDNMAVFNASAYSDDVIRMRNIAASEKEADYLFTKYNLAGKKALEIGCAFGNVVRFLRKAGCDCIGYEIGKAQLEFISEVVKEYVFNKNFAEKSDLEENSMDFIFSKAVLEHIPEGIIDKLLDNIYAALKPGGVTQHNIDTSYGSDPTHVNIQTPEYWVEKFKKHGFKITDLTHESGNGIYYIEAVK